MDLEAIPIQIQTPSKEDEDETLPELNDPLESVMTDDQFAEEVQSDAEEKNNAAEEMDEETPAEPKDQNTRENEIVVGDAKDELAEQNGDHNRSSSLSSAPGSEADDADDSKPGKNSLGILNLIEDIVVEQPNSAKPSDAKGIKLGDVEGARARLDKFRGSDELLKVQDLHRIF